LQLVAASLISCQPWVLRLACESERGVNLLVLPVMELLTAIE
jgi:hypothetical protein